MATVLVYTSPAHGHLFPVLGTAVELRTRGHDVHVRTLAGAQDMVRDLGVSASPVDPRVEQRQLDDWRATNPLQAISLAMATFTDRAGHEVDDLLRAKEEVDPDVLLVDVNAWGAQAVAEGSGLPWATFQPYFTPLTGAGVPPFGPGLPLSHGVAGRIRDGLVGPLLARWMERHSLPGINAPRQRVGLHPLKSMDAFLTRPPRVLYYTIEELEYPRASWPECYRFVGPGAWSPPSEDDCWIDDGDRPVALVTCSTEPQGDEGILEAAVQGLPDAGYLVVGTSATTSPDRFAGTPGVRVAGFVPHEAVLPRSAVVVCHGGMGVTQRALAAGVPVVVIPFGRDQLEVARRVERAGAGVMLPNRKLSPSTLAHAVEAARSKENGAREMAGIIAARDRDAGAGVIEELLDGRVAAGRSES